ncbi:MAG: glycosyltransferase [Micrococcales bacterium]|nr:glycosyltransferase [Micrococcales bacterium]
MSTLRVVLDPMLAPGGRYTEALTRALIATAPPGSDVAGMVAASTEDEYERIAFRLPGLVELHKSVLALRELRAAWQRGVTGSARGMVHATDLLAPLRRHDRSRAPGTQTVVTIRDARPWTGAEALPSGDAAWQRAMGRRAERFADAVVVPSHAVAERLADALQLGDRIRVIAGASISDPLPVDAEARAERMGLPPRYIAVEDLADERIARVGDALPIIVLGMTASAGGETVGAGSDGPRRVDVSDPCDLAVALGRAAVFAAPDLRDGLGMGVLQALHLGVPVVHAASAEITELTAEAGVSASAEELPEAIRAVLDDPALRQRLSVQGRDRAKAFSWRDSAEKVWQLHADL